MAIFMFFVFFLNIWSLRKSYSPNDLLWLHIRAVPPIYNQRLFLVFSGPIYVHYFHIFCFLPNICFFTLTFHAIANMRAIILYFSLRYKISVIFFQYEAFFSYYWDPGHFSQYIVLFTILQLLYYQYMFMYCCNH